MDAMGENMCNRSDAPFYLDKENSKIITEEIAPYWKDRSFPEKYAANLPQETRDL